MIEDILPELATVIHRLGPSIEAAESAFIAPVLAYPRVGDAVASLERDVHAHLTGSFHVSAANADAILARFPEELEERRDTLGRLAALLVVLDTNGLTDVLTF